MIRKHGNRKHGKRWLASFLVLEEKNRHIAIATLVKNEARLVHLCIPTADTQTNGSSCCLRRHATLSKFTFFMFSNKQIESVWYVCFLSRRSTGQACIHPMQSLSLPHYRSKSCCRSKAFPTSQVGHLRSGEVCYSRISREKINYSTRIWWTLLIPLR